MTETYASVIPYVILLIAGLVYLRVQKVRKDRAKK